MLTLFPEIEPYRSFRLPVSPLHEIHVEEAGNPDGYPVLFFHGGPGAGLSPTHRRFFDPAFYRVVLFDQRGSGKSTPLGELRDNSTWDLLDDAEQIRLKLGIEKWLVFGGSWGSTLGLAYGERYPDRTSGLILRGIFLGRPAEIAWTFGDGLRRICPDGWAEFVAGLSPRERGSTMRAYHRLLTEGDAATQRKAALAWNLWEERTSQLVPQLTPPAEEDIPGEIALARIEAHYFVNACFFGPPDQLLREIERIRHIPGFIIQGRYDMVCPAISAWDLHEAWPEAHFEIIPDAGHAATEPGIVDALVRATEEFKKTARGG